MSVVVAVSVLAAGAGHAGAAGGGPDPAEAKATIVQDVNAFRAERQLDKLSRNARLEATAQDFAAFMARTGKFGHEADGRDPSDRAEAHGYAYCIVSENIAFEQRRPAFSTDELANRLFTGWKNSPPHRHNMLQPEVVETGVGLAQGEGGRWYAVQLFGRPESDRVSFEVANPTGRTVRYRLGEQTYELAPRVTRTHQECRVRDIALASAGPNAAQTPRTGDRFVVVGDSGEMRLTRER